MEVAAVIERVEQVSAVRGDPGADVPAIEGGLRSVRRVRAWLDASEADLAGRLKERVSFPESTLADTSMGTLGAASTTIERAETLGAVPDFAAALDDGSITAGHVDAITRAGKGLDDGQRAELFERVGDLADTATGDSVDRFRRRVRDLARDIQRDDGLDRLERQRRDTRMRTWVDREGMWNVRGRFDPLTGVRINAALDAAVETLFAESTPDTCPADPVEKQAHLRALAFARLARGATGAGPSARPSRPEFVVVVDVTPTGDAADGGLRVEWPIPVEVPAAVLAELMGDGDVSTVVVCNGIVLYAPGELNLGRDDTVGQPRATAGAARPVRHVRDPGLCGPLRPLQAAPRRLVASRRSHRPRQPAAVVLASSPPGPRRRLATDPRPQPRAHHHVPRRHGPQHRPAEPTRGVTPRQGRPAAISIRRDSPGRAVQARLPLYCLLSTCCPGSFVVVTNCEAGLAGGRSETRQGSGSWYGWCLVPSGFPIDRDGHGDRPLSLLIPCLCVLSLVRGRCVLRRVSGSTVRATSGPPMARMRTYAAAIGPSAESSPWAIAMPAMMMENSPRAISTAPARIRPAGPMPAARTAHHPVAILGSCGQHGQTGGRRQRTGELGGVDLEAEERKEHRREQIPQRGQHLAGSALRRPAQRDPDQERPDRR